MAEAKYDKCMVKVSREGLTDPHNPEYLGAEIEGYMGRKTDNQYNIGALYTRKRNTWTSNLKEFRKTTYTYDREIER